MAATLARSDDQIEIGWLEHHHRDETDAIDCPLRRAIDANPFVRRPCSNGYGGSTLPAWSDRRCGGGAVSISRSGADDDLHLYRTTRCLHITTYAGEMPRRTPAHQLTIAARAK